MDFVLLPFADSAVLVARVRNEHFSRRYSFTVAVQQVCHVIDVDRDVHALRAAIGVHGRKRSDDGRSVHNACEKRYLWTSTPLCYDPQLSIGRVSAYVVTCEVTLVD